MTLAYDESLLQDGQEKRVSAEELQYLYDELSSKDSVSWCSFK